MIICFAQKIKSFGAQMFYISAIKLYLFAEMSIAYTHKMEKNNINREKNT